MTKIYTLKIKLAAVNDYLDGGDSIRVIAKKYGVSKTMLHRWVARFENHGKDGLQATYTKYSFEFKMDVLNYMNEVGASIDEATAVFNISYCMEMEGNGGSWLKLKELTLLNRRYRSVHP